MKKLLITLLHLFTTVSLTVIIYSCSGTTIEDCDCDDYARYDTIKMLQIDTVTSTDTVTIGKPIYFVQIGCFYNKNYAEKFASNAQSKLSREIIIIPSKDNLYRIFAGESKDITLMRELLSEVKSKGYLDSFIRDQYGPVEK